MVPDQFDRYLFVVQLNLSTQISDHQRLIGQLNYLLASTELWIIKKLDTRDILTKFNENSSIDVGDTEQKTYLQMDGQTSDQKIKSIPLH